MLRQLLVRILLVVILVLVVSASGTARRTSVPATIPASTSLPDTLLNLKPKPAPARWRALMGEYVLDSETVIIREKEGKLSALIKRTALEPLRELSTRVFEAPSGDRVVFSRDRRGRVTQLRIGKLVYQR